MKRRHGADALLDAIEQLQGAPLPASILETEILPARIDVYDPADLDAVTAAGEVVWVGVEPLGERDGRVALYLADHLPRLLPPNVAQRGDRMLTDRAKRRFSNSFARAAHRSSARCTKRAAAAIRPKPSTPCGIWSGRGSSPTTRFTRCARLRARRARRRKHKAGRGADVPVAPARAAIGRRAVEHRPVQREGRQRWTPRERGLIVRLGRSSAARKTPRKWWWFYRRREILPRVQTARSPTAASRPAAW